MHIVGAWLAIAAGVGYNTAAVLEKREALVVGTQVPVRRLLPALARRRWWIVAMALSLVAWGGQTVALALAPIAAVIPLMSAGRVILVVLGIRWLRERFGAGELAAVAVLSLGAVAAAVTAGEEPVSRSALPFLTQLLIAGVVLGGGLLLTLPRTGIGYGLAAGLLYSATAVYSKEVGDRFAVHGLAAVRLLAESPAPWALLALAVIAQAYIQAAFQRANAASATSAMNAVATLGPVLIGFVVYHEEMPHGPARAVLLAGIALVVAGTAYLSLRVPTAEPHAEAAAASGDGDASSRRPEGAAGGATPRALPREHGKVEP